MGDTLTPFVASLKGNSAALKKLASELLAYDDKAIARVVAPER